MQGATLPALLKRNAEKYGDSKTAIREKEYGIWQSFTWRHYYENVKYLALGLAALGFEAGDALAIIGDNRPEWLYSELAAQSLKGRPLGIYQDSILTEVAYVINHSDAHFVVAEDQEQTDKVLDMSDELPHVKRIIYTDPKGMRAYDDPRLIFFPEVLELGHEFEKKNPGFYEKTVDSLVPSDLALIAYTSGTTGFPKGSLLSHSNMLKMALNLHQVDPKTENDQIVSFLPLPWIGEQMIAVSSALALGFTVNFPEEPETAMADLYDIGPNVVFSPPRVWEQLSRSVIVKHLDASPLKQLIYRMCMPIGYQMADFHFERRTPPFLWKVLYRLSYIFLFRALKDRLGFSNIRSATTGGAALGPDVFRFFHACGVNLKQIYGQTEISGISCIHREGRVDFSSVGEPIPETEVKIADPDPQGVGEIVSRSPALFEGYLKNDDATKETIIEGWLHSGDAGYLTDDGQLVCIDRVKDLMKLTSKARFSPMFIENKLKFCPYIIETCVLGHERDYVTAMICIDYKHTGKWAEEHRLGYTTYQDLAGKPEVYDLIEREVVRVNRTLPEAARIERFLLLYKEFDPDDGELTRTRKLRRRFIAERYAKEIEALYQELDQVHVESEIKYQDGKTATIITDLAIRRMRGLDQYALEAERKWWQFWKPVH
ncbi:MAG: AMP-binding protein [Deltaproteobacteria bacterium]|nr:AMP-binding protein [Deltaproteobacteria bacterium]